MIKVTMDKKFQKAGKTFGAKRKIRHCCSILLLTTYKRSTRTLLIYLLRKNVALNNTPAFPPSDLSPCSQEEAGTRLLLHASTCEENVIIKIVDTDVIVIAVSLFFDINITEF